MVTRELWHSDDLDLGENGEAIGLVFSSLRHQWIRPTEHAGHDAFTFQEEMLYYEHYSTLC